MPLVSIEFALCFLLFFGVYWLFVDQVKIQNALLMLAGFVFIATWQWQFLVNLALVWVITEVTIALVHRFSSDGYQNNALRKLTMQLGVGVLVVQLFVFKYLAFGIEQVNELANAEITPVTLLLPLGLSFYTFQAISYIADFYTGKTQKIPSLVSLGIFSAFATITAGPIFRPSDAKSQWLPKQGKTREILLPYMAMVLIVIALLKKVVLAGWLADVWVSPIFADPLQYHPLEVLTGIYGYALQLFFDFSGYTDLVIAIGLLLGFRLPVNFNAPYLAVNIRDFWQRWHISLSHWIRDYLYIPLGGSRGGWVRTQINLMLAFILSGMWHGAGWNFFIWGAIHGIALVWLNLAKQYNLPKVSAFSPWLAIVITFHYVCFGWVFFHSTSLEQVGEIFMAIFSFSETNPITLPVYATLGMMLIVWLLYPWLAKLPQKIVGVLEYLPWWILSVPVGLAIVMLFSFAPAGLPGFIYANF